jgi:transcription elongation factor GreA
MPELPEELRTRPPRRSGQVPSAVYTIDAYTRLKAELDDLKGRGRTEMAERLLHARELGDLKENAEYDAAKNSQGLMEARIRDLEAKLRDPDIVETPAHSDEVGPGMLVTVRDEDGDEDTYLLAASAEEKAKGARTITLVSPLGSVLVGAKAGDSVTYEAPGGSFTYTVVSFEPYAG